MKSENAKRGRPVDPLPVAACDRLAEWLASGRTVASFCRASGLSVRVVNRWLDKSEELRDARIVGHDTLASECLDIADNATNETVACDKLRIDTRRWLLSRWSPERYGEAKGSSGSGATVVVVTGVPRSEIPDPGSEIRETTPTPGRSPLAHARDGEEEHNTSNTQTPSKPRVTVEIDPPSPDDPLTDNG